MICTPYIPTVVSHIRSGIMEGYISIYIRLTYRCGGAALPLPTYYQLSALISCRLGNDACRLGVGAGDGDGWGVGVGSVFDPIDLIYLIT